MEPGEYVPGGAGGGDNVKPITEARRLYRELEVRARRARSLPMAPRNPSMAIAA